MQKENLNVPFQVQTVIDGMLNETENVFVRGNYRQRLDQIRLAINGAIRLYDEQYAAANVHQIKRKKRA